MNIRYNLVSLHKDTSPLRVVITHKGKAYRKSVGISVSTKDWKDSKQKCNNRVIDERLKRLRLSIETELDEQSSAKDIEDLISRIEDGSLKERENKVSEPLRLRPHFMDFFQDWADKETSSKRQKTSTYNIIDRLMGRKDWDDLGDPYYFRLMGKMEDEGFSTNYQGAIIKKLKTVIHLGCGLGYADINTRRWKTPTEDAFAIVLSADDMEKLWNAELKLSAERKVRDLAWLGYLTASRFSDYSRLTEKNIHGDVLSFYQVKTGGEIMLPCSPRIREILARNGGCAPQMTDVVFNRVIKDVCLEVGITDIVQVPNSKRVIEGWSKDEDIQKWQLVSSHTLRRSALTHLYTSGVPAPLCMKISGHKTLKDFMRYIKMDANDALKMMTNLDFFK